MARGSKRSYTSKQRRQARHIEDSEQKRGRSPSRAAQIAWATVNKQDGGGKQAGSGRTRTTTSGRKGARTRADATAASRKPGRSVARKPGRKG